MKAIQLLFNSILPDDLKNYNQDLSAKTINKVLYAVAKKHPDQFADTLKKVADIGRKASWMQGETITLKDLVSPIDKKSILSRMRQEIAEAKAADPANFEKNRDTIWQRYNSAIEKETANAALANRNNIAMAVLSGARGKNAQLKAMISTPGTYSDYKDRIIPIFINESFAEGIRPAGFMASHPGARKSVTTAKNSTARGGDIGKQMSAAAANLVVRERDCKTHNGVMMPLDDKSLHGRVLADDAGDIKAGTLLDRQTLSQLKKSGVKEVVARDAITCTVPNGLCSKCVGAFYNGGKFPKVGASIGLVASTVTSEPVVQGSLCLEENTLVRMADFSVKKIKDIKAGDWVLGADEDANTFSVQVTNLYDQGMQEVWDFSFKKGQTREVRTVTATAAHKGLLNKRYSSRENKDKYGHSYGKDPYKIQVMPYGEMSLESYVVYPRVYTGTESISIPDIMAYMAGAYIGDGIRFQLGGTVRISCADPVMVERINKDAAPSGLSLKKRKRSHDWAFTRNTTHGRNPFNSLLERMGMVNKYCYEKVLPREIWSWDDTSLLNLIAGYFDTDGSVYRCRAGNYGISFLSTSEKLISGLKDILEFRFAIHSTPIGKQTKLSAGAKHLKYSIAINASWLVKRFADLVSPYCRGVKRERLEQLDFSEIVDRSPRGHTFGKLKSRMQKGMAHCYDIEVDHPAHLFVLANGFIVSNSTKHTAGMSSGKREYGGLDVITQFIQSPEVFKDRAAVAEDDGVVERVEDAPQGGKYITVSGVKQYIPTGHDAIVKPGDRVEAGDQLSDGLIDPEDVVRLKGVGAGQLYYAQRLNKILEASGAKTDPRNTEILARAAINHVRITDPDGMGNNLPDDVVSYTQLAKHYAPPKTARVVPLQEAAGKYLQTPVLHYTIGTRLTPSVLDTLRRAKKTDVYVDDDAPQFEPEMVRLRTAAHVNPDWLASQATSYLGSQLQSAAVRGDETNIQENDDYRPRLAVGVGFGEHAETTGKF